MRDVWGMGTLGKQGGAGADFPGGKSFGDLSVGASVRLVGGD